VPGALIADIMRPSSARHVARSTSAGASPSAAICCGPVIIDSIASARIT